MSSGNLHGYTEASTMRLSYLRARDPSIINFNAPRLPLPVNLENRYSENNQCEEETVDHLSVFLRIKNGVPYKDLYEIDENNLVCNVPEGSYCTRNTKCKDQLKKIFTFTKIFGSEARQVDVFNYMVKPKVLRFINGHNSTLFTYGVSGSGKTFTIVGTADEPGIIPRALEYIFRTIKAVGFKDDIKPLPAQQVHQMSKEELLNAHRIKTSLLNASLMDKNLHGEQYRRMQESLSLEPVADLEAANDVYVSVWVSFAEIYNEHIYDLLTFDQKNRNKPKLRLGCVRDETYIKQLTSVNVRSGVEAYQILQFGLHNLKYASTALNCHSSRSHSIFTIKMVQWKKNSDVCISTINFCDLAGSERLKKTGNVGDRLKESNNINNSLLVLGRCIENIRTGQKMNHKSKPIPFRESKLTTLFQKALMGCEDMNIIITINPSLEMFDESQHALNFASIAQEIVIVEKPVRSVRNRFSEMLEHKRGIGPLTVEPADSKEEVDRLRKELQQCQEQIMDLQAQMIQMETEHCRQLERTVDQAAAGFRNIWELRLQRVEENARNEQQRLIDYYEEKIRDLQTDVIEISGSSSDEELDEKGSMLKDAQECFEDLQSQMLQLREVKNELLIRNMQLEEQNAKLEEQLLYQQTLPLHTRDIDTDVSNDNSEEEGDLIHFQ